MDIKKELESYINSYLYPEPMVFAAAFKTESHKARKSFCQENVCFDACADISVEEFIKDNKDDNLFQTLLYRFIDRTNLKDSDIYNKVNMDRRLFSKLRNLEYHPSKETVILLGLALELNEDEIEDFLKSASYSLPKNNKYDLIIRFCFINKIYDVFKVNNLLDDYGFKTLN